MPKVHYFSSTGEAYDCSQCDDGIENGDVLVVESENAVAILMEAWPAALEGKYAGENFHVFDSDHDITKVYQYGGAPREYKDYSESKKLAIIEQEKLPCNMRGVTT